MIRLADTHAVIWVITSQFEKLGRRASQIFRDAERGRAHIVVSVVSLFEMSLLNEKKRGPTLPIERIRQRINSSTSYSLVDLTGEAVSKAIEHPDLRDPFDRLIAGHALSLDYPLLTKDKEFARLPGLETIWD